MDVVAVQGVGAVEGGHHACGIKPGQAVDVPVLGLEEVATVAEFFDAYVDVFHEVGGEGFEGGVGVGGLNLRFEFFA